MAIQLTSPTAMTSYLNEYQEGLNELQGYDALSEGSVDKFMEDQLGMDSTMPEAPKYKDMYEEMREQYGVDELEQSMNWYKDMIRREELLLNQQKNYMREQPVRLGVIEGRVDKATRDRQEQIQWYSNELSRVADRANSAYGQIQMIMQLTQMDYETAKDQYQTEFNNRMSVYKTLVDQFNADRAFASTQWSMMASFISKGQITWDAMSADQKAQVAKYEAQMGLPIGFMSNLKMEAGANIISSTQRVAPNGNTYVDMVYQDANGQTKVRSVLTGKTRIASSGGSSTSRNSYGFSSTEWSGAVKDAREIMFTHDQTNQSQYFGEDADNILADWEINNVLKVLNKKYGEAGTAIFTQAWDEGNYMTWDYKANKAVRL